jgi:hypothetical protein
MTHDRFTTSREESIINSQLPWPNGARCAVAVTFDMDADSLVPIHARARAAKLIPTTSMLKYAPTVGVPRIRPIASSAGPRPGRGGSHGGRPATKWTCLFRCEPQVMGAVLDQIMHAGAIPVCELNAVSDNPLIDPDTGDILSGGNFLAQPIGLPAFLVAAGGLNSGFMVAQVKAAILASENKSLSHTNSIEPADGRQPGRLREHGD